MIWIHFSSLKRNPSTAQGIEDRLVRVRERLAVECMQKQSLQEQYGGKGGVGEVI